jgi:hypothetical protein
MTGADFLPLEAPPVIRSYCLSVDAFDHLKAMQRVYQRQDGVRLTNSQTLERLITDHERSISQKA